jgi:hypothetical protein
MNSLMLTLLNWKTDYDYRYSTILSQGPFELRFYQRQICAKVSLNTNFEESLIEGTRMLKDYIGGNNFKVDKIMHRGPFFQIQRADSWVIGFFLPVHMTMSNIPRPINRSIRLEELLPTKVGALKFKGDPSCEKFLKKGEELNRWLKYKGIPSTGPLRITRPDFEIPLPFLRQSEVQLDVQ